MSINSQMLELVGIFFSENEQNYKIQKRGKWCVLMYIVIFNPKE